MKVHPRLCSSAGIAGVALVSLLVGAVAADTKTAAGPMVQPTVVKLPPPGTRPAPPTLPPATNGAAVAHANPAPTRAVPAGARFKHATVAEFEQLRTRPDAVVVDVRTAEEFSEGHIPQAALADIGQREFLAAIAGLDRSRLYLVNCAAGTRSARACQNFTALGFTNVVNLDGGFNEWKRANPTLISKEPAAPLPKSKTPNMTRSGTGTTPPPARPASTNPNPVFKGPILIKQTPTKP